MPHAFDTKRGRACGIRCARVRCDALSMRPIESRAVCTIASEVHGQRRDFSRQSQLRPEQIPPLIPRASPKVQSGKPGNLWRGAT